MITAQEIINESIKEDNLKVFYPELYKQKEADLNLSRCLRELEK